MKYNSITLMYFVQTFTKDINYHCKSNCVQQIACS